MSGQLSLELVARLHQPSSFKLQPFSRNNYIFKHYCNLHHSYQSKLQTGIDMRTAIRLISRLYITPPRFARLPPSAFFQYQLHCQQASSSPSSLRGAKSFTSSTKSHCSNCNMAETGAWGAWQAQPSKFTQAVVDAMRTLYPEELADRSWDNVGLLLGNSDAEGKKPKVLVTNDLTWQVADDAIKQEVSVIVSYHPFIFSGLKSITNADPQQATLLRLAQAGIAVYCPHTAVDAAPKGLNTWLADIVSGSHTNKRSVAIPCSTAPESHSPAGYGALGHFDAPVSLTEIIKRLASQLGGLKHVMVASPVGAQVRTTKVRSFGVCAGSGYDVLKNADVDLLVTGETSHHSALRAIQQGRTLVQVFHSNSERAYLQNVLRPNLQSQLKAAVPDAEVVVSQFDKDPFTILSVDELN